jgi:hypothetical protein
MVDARIEAHIANWNGGDRISMVGHRVTDGIIELKQSSQEATRDRKATVWRLVNHSNKE